MVRNVLLGLLILAASSSSAPAAAPIPDLVNLVHRASTLGLARDSGWLSLLHYRAAPLGGYHSEADDPAFFLSSDGPVDPQAELDASLRILFQPATGDEHPACRFPARRHWLQQRLRLTVPELHCPEFDTWRDRLSARGVSLIFPTAYINGPSSMFGHTFLRLDRANQTADNVLLSYTINYSAKANEDDSELAYAYRGLLGGYPGQVAVQPYYEKIKEYRDWENRDIWEYRLDLKPDEVDQLVRHAWELLPIRFDYYFMSENCSYRLLGLLDAARPGLGLSERFRYRTIPVDTVRALVAAGLVRETQYRPSAATLLKSNTGQLGSVELRWAEALAQETASADDPEFRTLPPDRRAAALETAYDGLRYRSLHERLPRDANAKTSYALLKARSALKESAGFAPPPTPAIRDDQGHRPDRFGAGIGFLAGQAYGELSLRSNYHDLTDPWPGYRQGAQIKFLDANLRFYEDRRFRLERFDLVSIRSLSPRDRFFTPLSWGVEAGARRRLPGTARPLMGYLSGEVGWSRELVGGLAFATAAASFEAGESLKSGADLGLGPRLGWLYWG
ncbi:MAG: DUF4105 domain-containing protein, partial [Methylococcaceae bacterium]|nr:DUF4105 domain-containing protein [Methylococcaceae bacterium]